MIEDIFVGVLLAIAVGAGFWVWWFENMAGKSPEQKKQTKEESNSKVVEK